MAPPGILSSDEHLEAVRSTCNIFSPAFSPMSKIWSTSTSTGINSSIFHDHDYVVQPHHHHHQQQQQQSFSESPTDSNSYDEEIDIACIDFDDFVSKTVSEIGDATGVEASNHGNKTTLANELHVDNLKCHLSGTNGGRLTEKVDNDKTSVSWFMDKMGDDFLDELATFDLELDEFDPCIDMDTDDSFQHFIEETLNSPATNTISMEDEYGSQGITDEGEDTYKKEYFLKLLGLQSVSHTTQNATAILEDCNTTTPCPYTSEQGLLSLGVETSGDSLCQRSTHPLSSSAILPQHPCSLAASVPAKMCSCATVDWKDSLLYSTAPICSNGLVQTNLSTAPTKSITYNMANQNFRFPSNSNDINLMNFSPSLGSSNNFKDLTACSLLREGLQQKSQSDADAFLQWLEEEGESSATVQPNTEISEASNKCTNFNNDTSVQVKVGDSNRVPELNRLSADHSASDLDSFIDLETYAMEKSPSSMHLGKDIHSNDLSNHVRDAEVQPEETLGHIESKYPSDSQLRFRLSLLDDLSCRKDRFLEKRDASCPFGITIDDVNGSYKDYTFDDALADLTSDAVSSPLSPYSSSSVNSSYGQPKGAEDSLDLLELFSEENSFLLMDQSDSRYGFC